MHVVDQLESEEGFEIVAEEDTLLVRVNEVVAPASHQHERPNDDERVQEELQRRGADLDLSEKRKVRDANDADAGDLDVPPPGRKSVDRSGRPVQLRFLEVVSLFVHRPTSRVSDSAGFAGLGNASLGLQRGLPQFFLRTIALSHPPKV